MLFEYIYEKYQTKLHKGSRGDTMKYDRQWEV